MVTFEQAPGVMRTVEVVVTPADWDDYVSTIYGTGDPSATVLRDKLLALPDGAEFLVYDNSDWEPSQARELPADDAEPGPGAWVVTDSDGSVIDVLAHPGD